jgi:hypothetical protein
MPHEFSSSLTLSPNLRVAEIEMHRLIKKRLTAKNVYVKQNGFRRSLSESNRLKNLIPDVHDDEFHKNQRSAKYGVTV